LNLDFLEGIFSFNDSPGSNLFGLPLAMLIKADKNRSDFLEYINTAYSKYFYICISNTSWWKYLEDITRAALSSLRHCGKLFPNLPNFSVAPSSPA